MKLQQLQNQFRVLQQQKVNLMKQQASTAPPGQMAFNQQPQAPPNITMPDEGPRKMPFVRPPQAPTFSPAQQNIPHLTNSSNTPSPQSVQVKPVPVNNNSVSIPPAGKLPSGFLNEPELQALISTSQSNGTASIAEDLIAHFGLEANKDSPSSHNANSNAVQQQAKSVLTPSALLSSTSILSNAEKDPSAFTSVLGPNGANLEWAQKNASNRPPPQPKLSINMSSAEVIEACKGVGKSGHIIANLVNDDGRPPRPPDPPYPPLPRDRLSPQAPSVFVSLRDGIHFFDPPFYFSPVFSPLSLAQLA